MARSPVRSLWPREHGAYGQLALPLLTALLSGRPSGPAGLYAFAAVCAFLAHEPLLVLLGHRGPRAQRECAGSARVRLALLSAGALLCGALALAAIGHADAGLLVVRATRTTEGSVHAALDRIGRTGICGTLLFV